MGKEISEIKRVRYRSGIKDNGEDGKEYRFDYMSVDLRATKRYNNAVCVLMGIDGCAYHLIEWLSINVTAGGYVNNNVITRQAFISFHAKHKKSNKSYGEDSVNKAFKKLTDEELLIQINKGTYRINPLMYFIGEEDDRIKAIKWVMEFRAGVETKISREVTKK